MRSFFFLKPKASRLDGLYVVDKWFKFGVKIELEMVRTNKHTKWLYENYVKIRVTLFGILFVRLLLSQFDNKSSIFVPILHTFNFVKVSRKKIEDV